MCVDVIWWRLSLYNQGHLCLNDCSHHNIHARSTDTHPDAFPNTMTPADPVLNLDAGFPPWLRSHRHVDVILSLNYSWEQDQFKGKTWKVDLKCKYQELIRKIDACLCPIGHKAISGILIGSLCV